MDSQSARKFRKLDLAGTRGRFEKKILIDNLPGMTTLAGTNNTDMLRYHDIALYPVVKNVLAQTTIQW